MDSLIGRKAEGFKFDGFPNYTPSMKKYEFVIGEIMENTYNTVKIRFPDGHAYNYPYPEAIKHLVEEEIEQSIEEILNNIKNLTKDI